MIKSVQFGIQYECITYMNSQKVDNFFKNHIMNLAIHNITIIFAKILANHIYYAKRYIYQIRTYNW